MTYEFLANYHKRVEIIAIVDFITTRASRKTKLKEYGIGTEEAMNLIMLVLCYIMEKSLVEEACTKNDIASFIGKLDNLYLKKHISEEGYLQIADVLIKECLQNNGIPYYFHTHNFETEKEEDIHVKLIDDKRIPVENESIYSYYMTPQGYKFMFNTLEIESAMQVSIEQFKLSLSIKKKNFSVARNNVDSLSSISKTQIQRINYFIKKIREDISSAGIDEYEKIYNATFASIDEQNEGYDSLYQLIVKAEESMQDSGHSGVDMEAFMKELKDISYIKNKLKFIINEQTALLLKQQELQKIYNEAIDNILYVGFDNRLDFDEIVTKRLEADPALSYPLIKILRPLFRPELNKFFNIKMALKEQRMTITDSEKEDNNLLFSRKYLNRFESENDIKIRRLNKQYLDIFETICKYVLLRPQKRILLSELIIDCQNEYDKLVPDLKVLTSVLLQLSGIGSIDFTVIKEQKLKTVFQPTEEFDVKYCVLMLLEGGKTMLYNNIAKMKIVLARNKTVFIPEHIKDADDAVIITTGLTCPDISFQIEVEEIE